MEARHETNPSMVQKQCKQIAPDRCFDWIFYLSMIRVLIIDDQPAFRKQLCSVLNFTGLVVAGEAATIRAALKLLPVVSADLAIVDVDLPGINGIQGTLLLKKASPKLRVILVSAYSDQSALFKQAAASVGAEKFISKEHLDPEVIKGWGRS